MFRLFRHKHRYRRLVPGVVRDGLTGRLFPFTRFVCICGQERPSDTEFRRLIEQCLDHAND
jgi:hypothetical protein